MKQSTLGKEVGRILKLDLTIRMKETVVVVLPNGAVGRVKAGREVKAAQVTTPGANGPTTYYLVLGETGFPRLVPKFAAELIDGIPEPMPGTGGALPC